MVYLDWWDWRWTAGVLCAVGCFKEFQPSEPFLIDYAIEFRNFTASQMVHEILPVTTYGYFASLFILVLVTDFLRYKPIIIVGGVASVVCWSMSIWFYDTQTQAQIRQFAEAISLSTEIAYFTYMYANVDRSHYRKVTSYSHSALHVGRFFGGICGQLILSSRTLDLEGLNYITLGGVCFSLVASFFLPTVKKSIYFDSTRFSVISNFSGASGGGGRRATIVQANNLSGLSESDFAAIQNTAAMTSSGGNRKMGISLPKPKQVGFKKRIVRASRALIRDFKIAYTNRYVLKWSLWWSIAQAIYLQVGIYAEPLWKEIADETHQSIYNGVIDASHAALSAVLAIAVSYIRSPMIKYGEIYLSIISLLQGGALLMMSQTHSLYAAYGCYIGFQTSFQVVIIIATAEVAESIKEDSEAFIFGLNTLVALTIQTILTYAVADDGGFDLEIRMEFVVYAAYLGILGVIFLLIGIQRRTRHWDVSLAHADNANFTKKGENEIGNVPQDSPSSTPPTPSTRNDNDTPQLQSFHENGTSPNRIKLT